MFEKHFSTKYSYMLTRRIKLKQPHDNETMKMKQATRKIKANEKIVEEKLIAINTHFSEAHYRCELHARAPSNFSFPHQFQKESLNMARTHSHIHTHIGRTTKQIDVFNYKC